MKPYFICATPRTGTNLLCEALAKSGVAGRPDEYFGRMHESRWRRRWGVANAAGYVQRLMVEAATPNGVWGVKVMMQYFEDVYDLLVDSPSLRKAKRFEILERAFGPLNYIWMTRRDKIAQAVSLHKAYQNFVWIVEKGEAMPDESLLVYDFDQIDRILFEIIQNEAQWEEYFATVGQRPVVVVYEDFIADYAVVVNAVLRHLGLDYPFVGTLEESSMQRLQNQLSTDWIRRFRQEKVERQASEVLKASH